MQSNYRPDIDGLRALAVLSVVIFHAFPARLPGGFIGVDIFFVISGYLISGIIFNELAEKRFSFARFYARRIRRIFPALVLVLGVSYVFGWFVLLSAEYAQLGKHIASSAAFIQNLTLWNEQSYFDRLAETKTLLHLWSLGIEEQFYFIWPIALLILIQRKKNPLIPICLIALFSFSISLWTTYSNSTAAFYSPISRFWELLVGSILAWHAQSMQHPIPLWGTPQKLARNTAAITGVVLIGLGLLLIQSTSAFPGGWALLPVTGTALIIWAGPRASLNRRLFSNQIMVWVGLISYPLYLWHWPLLSFLRIIENEQPSAIIRLSAVVISIALAWLTYILVEKKIRYSCARTQQMSTRWLCAALGLLAIVGCITYLEQGFFERTINKQNEQTAKYLSMDAPPETSCLGILNYPTVQPFCTRYSSVNPKKTILLWGDSTALSWLPVFLTIAKENNYSIVKIAHFSCPPILGARKTHFSYAQSRQYCSDGALQKEVLEFILSLRPDLIVLLSSWSTYGTKEFITSRSDEAATRASTEAIFADQFPKTVSQLEAVAQTIIFKSWPTLPQQPNQRIIPFLGKYKTEVVLKQSIFNDEAEHINRVFSKLTGQQLSYFDPAQKVCDGSLCHSEVNGIRLYTDTYHLSPQGALWFKADIESLLQALTEP